MFIKTIGQPNKPSTFKVEVIGFHIMDVGNPGYTEFEYDTDELMDLYEKHPEYMDCRMGMLHSHNQMNTFFSGTDVEELEDNTINTDFMVSLIVNNASKYSAKVAWRTEQEVNIKTTGWFKNKAIQFIENKKNKSLYSIDLDIEIEKIEELLQIDARLIEINEAIKAKKALLIKTNNPTFNRKQLDAFIPERNFQELHEIKETNQLEYEDAIEQLPVMQGETFDNFLACLLVLNQNYEDSMIKAMQEIKNKVTAENLPLLIEMIIDNIEDYYEAHYGELCTIDVYMEICSAFISHLDDYNSDAFPIVDPLIDLLTKEIGE